MSWRAVVSSAGRVRGVCTKRVRKGASKDGVPRPGRVIGKVDPCVCLFRGGVRARLVKRMAH